MPQRKETVPLIKRQCILYVWRAGDVCGGGCVCVGGYVQFMQGHYWVFINSFSDVPMYFVIPALAQTVWAQHAVWTTLDLLL